MKKVILFLAVMLCLTGCTYECHPQTENRCTEWGQKQTELNKDGTASTTYFCIQGEVVEYFECK